MYYQLQLWLGFVCPGKGRKRVFALKWLSVFSLPATSAGCFCHIIHAFWDQCLVLQSKHNQHISDFAIVSSRWRHLWQPVNDIRLEQVAWRCPVSIISTLLACPNTFAIQSVIVCFDWIAEQGQCFLCYVQRALDMKVLAQPFLSNDKVRFNSDVGISGWVRWILDLWPMDLAQTFIVCLLCPMISKGVCRLGADLGERDHSDPDGTLITMGVEGEGGSSWSQWGSRLRAPKSKHPTVKTRRSRCSYLQSTGRLRRQESRHGRLSYLPFLLVGLFHSKKSCQMSGQRQSNVATAFTTGMPSPTYHFSLSLLIISLLLYQSTIHCCIQLNFLASVAKILHERI